MNDHRKPLEKEEEQVQNNTNGEYALEISWWLGVRLQEKFRDLYNIDKECEFPNNSHGVLL